MCLAFYGEQILTEAVMEIGGNPPPLVLLLFQ